jgi:predicted HicB family RNase H-like nuclease
MKGARELPKMMLRVPVEVKERLQQHAKESLRSLNSEIVGRLLRSLADDDARQNAGKQ